MTAFNLAALKPAAQIEGLGRDDKGPLTAKASALRNIDAQLALLDPKKEGKRTFWDTVLDGKRSYTGKGGSVGFYVKAGSSKLTINGTQELGVPKGDFGGALLGLKDAIAHGELDEQLDAIDGKLDARKTKARATRDGKKGRAKAA